jgi:hypothetical protein
MLGHVHMHTTKEFQVLVRRKIPYLSSSLWWVTIVLFAIVFLVYLIMTPTKNSSDEMATAYYILVVPDWLKKVSAIALAGLVILMPIYFSARLHKLALLTINQNVVVIKGKQIDIAIPIALIDKIYFNDLKNLLRRPKNKLQIVIQQKNKKLTIFLLKNYNEGEEAMDALGKIDKAEFAFYDDNMLTIHDEE